MLTVQPVSFKQVSFQKKEKSETQDLQTKLEDANKLMDDFEENGLKSEEVQEAVTKAVTDDKMPKLLKFFIFAAASSVVAFFGGKVLVSKGVKIIDNPKLGWMDGVADRVDKVLKDLPNKKFFKAPEEGKKGIGAVVKGWLHRTATGISNLEQKALPEVKVKEIQDNLHARLVAEMQAAFKKGGEDSVIGVIKKYSPTIDESGIKILREGMAGNKEELIVENLGDAVKNIVESLTAKEKAKGIVGRAASNAAGTISAVVTGAKTIAGGDKNNDGTLDAEEASIRKKGMISEAMKLLANESDALTSFLGS